MPDSDFARTLSYVNIEDEMRQSYMDYAMSVIIGRALPDVRDGLKPVHRRVLYTMKEMGNDYNKPHKKSARVVGDVMGKYHPHGDSAIYDTIVRMAQSFSLRYMLVDGQGNFGSVDGDSPAAMRYTEIRMAKIAHQLLADLDKETVDFTPNYDGSEQEPTVLPTVIPNLLINGSSGIAVGMATNIPPHNLSEVINGCLHLIKHPDASIVDLMQHIPGPDFPTSGIINGTKGIYDAYKTGHGRVHIRARAEIESHDKDESIVVTELPYQVNKARLAEKIADLVKEKRLTGIRDIRDESDKDGMRLVIELKRGEVANVVLNNLYKYTRMQDVFGINLVALNDNYPCLMNLKEILMAFISHRRDVVVRRTIFELNKAKERAHILEGLAVAIANIDQIIELIKKSANPSEAKTNLLAPYWVATTVGEMLELIESDINIAKPQELPEQYGLHNEGYKLSPQQAQAILELRLQKLTGIEHKKIVKEYKELLDLIRDLNHILSDPDKLMSVINDELVDINERFGDARRTVIMNDHQDYKTEDLIPEEDVVVTLSHAGYTKSQSISSYRSQKRGGRGKSATKVKDDDFIDKLFIANTHDTILCFSSRGQLYWLKVYELPSSGRHSRGTPIVNLLPLTQDERINAILAVREFSQNKFVFMATADGTVKKTPLSDFSKPRANGIRAIKLADDNQLIGVGITDGDNDIMLYSSAGKMVRFHESQVRSIGRTTKGMRGIRIKAGQCVVSLIITHKNSKQSILTATENGYGKSTCISDYPTKSRGSTGVISIKINERNGAAIAALAIDDTDEIMLISDQGTLVRIPTNTISVIGRNTQGVRLVNLNDNEKLVGIESIVEYNDSMDNEADDETDDEPIK